MPGSLPADTAFGYQRISAASSRLAPRPWRSLCACALSVLGRSHLKRPTDRNIHRAGYLERDDGRTDGHRLDNQTASTVHQRDGGVSDVVDCGLTLPLGNSVARNGEWWSCDDDDLAIPGNAVKRLTRSWRRVLLSASRGDAWSGFHGVCDVGARTVRLDDCGVGRWNNGLPWTRYPALFQTVDHSVRTVSRRRHDRHARHSGNPMKRGTKYGYSLRGLKSGDSGAWSWLVAEFSGKLVGYASRMGARDPEEVMSATLETIARRIADFEGNESQMRSFIFSIAHARIVDDLRRTTRRSEVSIENTLNLLEADEPNEDTFTDPDLLNALERLPEDQRRMLELRYVMGLSTKETADSIGKSEVATRVGLSRAFSRLKDLLIDDLRISAEEGMSS